MSVARHELPARLDLAAATPLAEALREKAGKDLVLDAAGTTHLGTPGLQVLLAARLSWIESGHELVLENADESFVAQLAQLGLSTADLSAPDQTADQDVE